MVTLVAVGLVAVVVAYIVWRVWPKQVNPPWGMSEFHRRLGRGHPKGSEKI